MDKPHSLELLERCIPLFDTLRDPQRQAIVTDLIVQGPQTVGEIAEGSPLSRAAVSHHVQILERSGLVVIKKVGTHRICQTRVDEGMDLLRELITALETDLADAQAYRENGGAPTATGDSAGARSVSSS